MLRAHAELDREVNMAPLLSVAGQPGDCAVNGDVTLARQTPTERQRGVRTKDEAR